MFKVWSLAGTLAEGTALQIQWQKCNFFSLGTILGTCRCPAATEHTASRDSGAHTPGTAHHPSQRNRSEVCTKGKAARSRQQGKHDRSAVGQCHLLEQTRRVCTTSWWHTHSSTQTLTWPICSLETQWARDMGAAIVILHGSAQAGLSPGGVCRPDCCLESVGINHLSSRVTGGWAHWFLFYLQYL